VLSERRTSLLLATRWWEGGGEGEEMWKAMRKRVTVALGLEVSSFTYGSLQLL